MNYDSPFPRPSVIQQAGTVLVVATCLALASCCVAGIQSGDSYDKVSSLLLCPWLPLLAALQYWGTYRYSTTAMIWVTAILAMFSVLLFLAGLQMLSVVATSKYLDAEGINISAILLVTLTATGGITVSNWLWTIELKQARNLRLVAPKLQGFSIKDLMLGMMAFGVVVGVSSYFYRSTPPHTFGRVANSDDAPIALPEGASQIVYWKGPNMTVFHCRADEREFLDWFNAGVGSLEARSAKLPLNPIESRRTLERIVRVSKNNYSAEPFLSTDGCYYQWRMEDRSLTVTYDRATEQVFYRSTSR